MHPNITKIIDQYLSGELSPEDRAAFEQRMNENTDLKQEVELQQAINEGAQRAGQRLKIQKIGKRYHLKQWLKWVGSFSAIIAVVATGALIWYNTQNWSDTENAEPVLTEELVERLNEDVKFENLKPQYFTVPKKGKVALSEKGVLLSIPENAFLHDGKPYSGPCIVQYQEAISGLDIIKAGLTTTSGDKLLETQGMFEVAGYTPEGEPLSFNPKVGVYVQVPIDSYKRDMQLFDGVVKPDGSIDWQNPKQLEKIPVAVDMSELDFYPPGYEDFLDEQKWKKDKQSRDSLYLSLEETTAEEVDYESYDDTLTILSNPLPVTPQEVLVNTRVENVESHADVAEAVIEGDSEAALAPYIYPSKVLGFWRKKFNNTILATRDFEKRMRGIHYTCRNAILDEYVRNLNKPLWEIDKKIAQMGYPEFEGFASERVGKMNILNPHFKQLQAYYTKATKQLKQQNKKNQQSELKRRKKWDDQVEQSRIEEGNRTQERDSKVLQEEIDFNLRKIKRQVVGPTKGFTINQGIRAIKNIDQYIVEATISRTTTSLIDPNSGDKIDIKYNDCKFEVRNSEQYIKLYAYFLPDKLNSYKRITGTNGKFDYRLNDDISYHIAIVGVKDNGYDYFQKQWVKGGNLGTIEMQHYSENKLKASLEQLNRIRNSKGEPINTELDWLILERANYKEQKLRMQMGEFRRDLKCTIFPCSPQTYVLIDGDTNTLVQIERPESSE